MQDAGSQYNAQEQHRTINTVVKGILGQEELKSLVAALASGKTEELDAYCGEDKVIRIYNDLRLGLAGDTTFTIPDGYALDGIGHNLTVTGGDLTISGDVRELYINGKNTISRRRIEKKSGCKRIRGCKPETEAKYRSALELYTATDLSYVEICRLCGVSLNGFSRYIGTYHRHLMLERNGIRCSVEKAGSIKIKQRRGQRPETHAKYKEAIAACDSMEYIEYNISQIAREFGLDGTNLARQLHTHYPEVLEFRERERQRLGLNDNLPRGTRSWCKEQYAEAVELLRADRYITVQEAAERCNVSYAGLEQHLIFYHKELVENRIEIRKRALRQQRKGHITGRGTLHAPSPETIGKYAEALELYRTTPLSARKIAKQTDVSLKGFYEYLQTWHLDLVCLRKGIYYDEGTPVDWSSVRRYNPATAAKYADAIARLKEGGLTTAKVAAEFGLQPENFRQYLKEHEPELHASLGMRKTENGRMISPKSEEKYKEAIHLYETTPESLKSIARRFGLNYCSLGQFIKRHFPELVERRRLQEQERKRKGEKAEPALKKEAEEKERILQALARTGGNKRNAAKLLGIGKTALYKKLQAYGLTGKDRISD